MDDHYFLLFGWGTFQVLRTDGSLIIACTSVGRDGINCHGVYREIDHFEFEVTGFFGETTDMKKNSQLIANLYLSFGRWRIDYIDEIRVTESFFTQKSKLGRLVSISQEKDGPPGLLLHRDPHQSEIFRPEFTEHFTSNIPLVDLYMALGFILCKNKF